MIALYYLNNLSDPYSKVATPSVKTHHNVVKFVKSRPEFINSEVFKLAATYPLPLGRSPIDNRNPEVWQPIPPIHCIRNTCSVGRFLIRLLSTWRYYSSKSLTPKSSSFLPRDSSRWTVATRHIMGQTEACSSRILKETVNLHRLVAMMAFITRKPSMMVALLTPQTMMEGPWSSSHSPQPWTRVTPPMDPWVRVLSSSPDPAHPHTRNYPMNKSYSLYVMVSPLT